jgi:outer membrane protein assembly factor BamB
MFPRGLRAAAAELAPAVSADWPQFLGPTRNGVYGGPALASSWSKEGPPIVWQRKVGQGFSGPAVAAGKLILFHRLEDKETVECLDASTGKPSWTFDYPTAYQDDFGFDEGPRATPAIDAGKVYTFGAEGALYCLDFATGKKIWNVDCKTQFSAPKGFFGIACSPLVEGRSVLLNVGGANGAGIVAFDKDSGKTLWRSTEDAASYSSPVAATIGGKRYALFFTRSGLVGVEPADGKIDFQFHWRSRMNASVNAATPLVVGDLIFISAAYQTGAALLRVRNGALQTVWSGDDALSEHYATGVYRDGFLYGYDARADIAPGCNLRCVELMTGKVRWSENGFGAGTILLAGDQLLVLRDQGELLIAPASTVAFKPTARAQILGSGVRPYPALANGRLFARSKDKLVCVDLQRGR